MMAMASDMSLQTLIPNRRGRKRPRGNGAPCAVVLLLLMALLLAALLVALCALWCPWVVLWWSFVLVRGNDADRLSLERMAEGERWALWGADAGGVARAAAWPRGGEMLTPRDGRWGRDWWWGPCVWWW